MRTIALLVLAAVLAACAPYAHQPDLPALTDPALPDVPAAWQVAQDSVGEVDVGWLDRLAGAGEHLCTRHAEVAVLQGAVDAYQAENAVERARFYATAARGRLRTRTEVGSEVELRCRGSRYAMRVRRIGPFTYRIDVDGNHVDVRVESLGPLERRFEDPGGAPRDLAEEPSLQRRRSSRYEIVAAVSGRAEHDVGIRLQPLERLLDRPQRQERVIAADRRHPFEGLGGS